MVGLVPLQRLGELDEVSVSGDHVSVSSHLRGELSRFQQAEVRLLGTADRAHPVVGDVLEGRPGRDAAVGVTLLRIVDESTQLAEPACGLRRRLPSARRSYRLLKARRPGIDTAHREGAPEPVRRPSGDRASVVHLGDVHRHLGGDSDLLELRGLPHRGSPRLSPPRERVDVVHRRIHAGGSRQPSRSHSGSAKTNSACRLRHRAARAGSPRSSHPTRSARRRTGGRRRCRSTGCCGARCRTGTTTASRRSRR